MTAEDFYKGLANTFPELQIFREAITVDEDEELPPAYIYYTTGTTQSMFADNIVWWSSTPITLYIVENKPGEELTAKAKQFLNDNRLPFEVAENAWEDELSAFVTTFDFNI
mgnify:CR=1 FL=1